MVWVGSSRWPLKLFSVVNFLGGLVESCSDTSCARCRIRPTSPPTLREATLPRRGEQPTGIGGYLYHQAAITRPGPGRGNTECQFQLMWWVTRFDAHSFISFCTCGTEVVYQRAYAHFFLRHWSWRAVRCLRWRKPHGNRYHTRHHSGYTCAVRSDFQRQQTPLTFRIPISYSSADRHGHV